MDTLKNHFIIDFIYSGHCYKFTASRLSRSTYQLVTNGSHCSVDIRGLSDGGFLLLLSERSHVLYLTEEPTATRLSIDQTIYLLEQENDPTQLRSPSPGKLVKYNVKSGDHIKAGETFAELEIMKMYMPLVAQEDGIVELGKQAGTMLEAGDLLGTLTLDDPLRANQISQPFLGHLPEFGPPQVVGVKPTQQFWFLYGTLNDILDGFDHQFAIKASFQKLLGVLRDPELPYSEWSVPLSALSSSIPQSLAASLTQIINLAKARGREFPAKETL